MNKSFERQLPKIAGWAGIASSLVPPYKLCLLLWSVCEQHAGKPYVDLVRGTTGGRYRRPPGGCLARRRANRSGERPGIAGRRLRGDYGQRAGKIRHPVALLAVIGRDALGDAVLADLAAVGVQTARVVREPKLPTSAAIVLANGAGERSFFYRTGGNEQLSNEHIPDAALQQAALVHVGGAMKLVKLDLAELTRRAKSLGCRTALDTDWDVFGSWIQRLGGALPQIDFLMTNAEEAAMLTGRQDSRAAAESLLAQGPQAVLVKRAGSAVRCWQRGAGSWNFPPSRWKSWIRPRRRCRRGRVPVGREPRSFPGRIGPAGQCGRPPCAPPSSATAASSRWSRPAAWPRLKPNENRRAV